MIDYENESEFKINKAVAEKVGYLVQGINDESMIGMNSSFREKYPNTVWVAEKDPITGEQISAWEQKCFTRIADDAWPIIYDNKISIEYRDHKSLLPVAKRFGSNGHNIADENPLKAAMIVFLND